MPSDSLPPALASLIRVSQDPARIEALVGEIIEQGLIECPLPVPQQGCSVLTWLIEKRHYGQAMRLLEAGANPVHASHAGYQAIHAAASRNHQPLAAALLARGASLHAPTKDGSTAVHYAFADDLDQEFAAWVLDRLGSPARAFMKKADLGFAAPDTVWGLMARYGRREAQLLEVLKLLDDRGMIEALLQSEKPAAKKAASTFQYELLHRFGHGMIGGWWRIRKDARTLLDATEEVSRATPRRRF